MQWLSDIPISNTSAIALVATASVAAWSDWTRWKIPNALIAASAAAALMLAVFAPDRIGLQACLLGGLVGFALFFPIYLARGMAAGDVKLLMVIGMHTGPWTVVDIALLSVLLGGVWALAVMSMKKETGLCAWLAMQWRARFGSRVSLAGHEPPKIARGRQMIPYGVVIALGTVAALW